MMNFHLIILTIIPQLIYLDIPIIVILLIFIGIFIYLVYLQIKKPLSRDGESEQYVYQRNRTLPNLTFKSSPTIVKRLYTYFMTAMLVFVVSSLLSASVGYAYFLLFLLLLTLIVLLLVGFKYVSFIEFTTTGIIFYTWLYKYARFGGRYFIPYEKCHIEYSTGFGRGTHDEGIFFYKGKFPYVVLARSSWTSNWETIYTELNNRLPKSHFIK